MQEWTHDLSLKECQEWMRDLGLVVRGKLNWKALLKEAGLGSSQQYVLPGRWAKGEAPEQRLAVRAALERLEKKRPERTPTGIMISALEEWNAIGVRLSGVLDVLMDEIERLQPKAEMVQRVAEAKKTMETEGRALLNISPSPTKPRK